MPTREQVLRLLDTGLSYEEVGERLGVRPGLAYMIATGIPADGSDSVTDEQKRRAGWAPVTQQLSNPAEPQNHTRKQQVLDWMRQRASSDAQMQAAAAKSRTSPPDIEPDDKTYDLLEVITRDHNKVNSLVKELSSVPSAQKGATDDQIEQRQLLADAIAVAVTRHERAEEEYLWPTVRASVPDGDRLADQAHEQEQQGLQTLTALAKADPAGEDFDDLVKQLSDELRKHVASEDQVLLALRSVTGADQRDELGRRFRGYEAAQTDPPQPDPPEPGAAKPARRNGRGKHTRRSAAPANDQAAQAATDDEARSDT